MTDPLYSEDFFLDMGIQVKEEMPMDTTTCMSASMPIPTRRIMCGMGNYNSFEYVDIPSTPVSQTSGIDVPSSLQGSSDLYNTLGGMTMWGARAIEEREPSKSDMFPMDDDEFFQLDKSDLIQGCSLVEISVGDDNFLDGISFDDILLPEENSNYPNVPNASAQSQLMSFPLVQVTGSSSVGSGTPSSTGVPGSGVFAPSFPGVASPASHGVASPTSHHSSSSSLPLHSAASSSATPPPSGASPLHYRHSTLHELLLRKETLLPDRQLLGQSVPGRVSRPLKDCHAATGAISVSRLSSSAPTHLGFEQIWQRREPRPHLLSTSSLAEAESISSLSTGGVLSPESHELSHDSDDNSDHYEDFSSDGESSDGEDTGSHKSSLSKKERYFWQYNVQAKGPKGLRLVLKTQLEDPHVLNEVTDPVFSPECFVQGIKHSGKARKGDGNDLTPNPRKLCNIGRELDKLARMINDITPVSELPFNSRPKTRKEKNKLASRACRLKKKAQHEANKIKLYGLEQEHKRINIGIAQLKQLLAAKFSTDDSEAQEELSMHMDRVFKAATKLKIAGDTTDFVNRILDKVKTGIPGGGLDEI